MSEHDHLTENLKRIMYSFRVMWTGVTYYHLYCNQSHLCSAATYSMPGFPVSISSSSGKAWHSEGTKRTADGSSFIRNICKQQSRYIEYRLINREKNTYIFEQKHFVLFHDLMKIDFLENGCYCFYQKGKMIAIARRLNYIDFEKPKDLPVEAEAYFEIRTAEELDPDVLAMIHAMPLL